MSDNLLKVFSFLSRVDDECYNQKEKFMAELNIIHANALTPSGLVSDALVGISNGIIVSLEKCGKQHLEGEVIDATGLMISPGWIDIQINGGFGSDFTDDPTAIWDVARELPRYGTTGFLPTIVSSPPDKVQLALDVLRKGPPPGWVGAQPFGLHVEGPFLNEKKKGAHNSKYLQTPSLDVIEGWSREKGIWMVTLAPELPGAAEIIEVLTARNVIISAGHTMATYDQALIAFERGVHCVTHLYNAMPPLLHRDPGLTGAFLTQSKVVAGLIADGIHCHPAMLQLAWQSRGPAGIALVTDAMGAMGMPPGNYVFTGFDITVDQSSARLNDGTLAGSILTADKSLRNMMNWFDLKMEDVIPALTSTPARLIDEPDKGHLSLGADADLVLLTASGQVMKTLVRGRLVFSG